MRIILRKGKVLDKYCCSVKYHIIISKLGNMYLPHHSYVLDIASCFLNYSTVKYRGQTERKIWFLERSKFKVADIYSTLICSFVHRYQTLQTKSCDNLINVSFTEFYDAFCLYDHSNKRKILIKDVPHVCRFLGYNETALAIDDAISAARSTTGEPG
jgi:hypothetical protein